MPKDVQVQAGESRLPGVPRDYARALGLPVPEGESDRIEVDVGNAWIEAPISQTRWRVAARIVMVPGAGPTIGELRIFPDEPLSLRPSREGGAPLFGEWSGLVLGVRARCPRGGVGMRLLRAVPLTVLKLAIPSMVKWALQKYGPAIFEEQLGRLGFAPPADDALTRPGGRRGRQRPDDLECARVAAAVEEALRDGSRRPLRDASDQLGMNYGRARDLLHQARSRRPASFSSTEQGRGGGVLTPYGRRLLARAGLGLAPRREIQRKENPKKTLHRNGTIRPTSRRRA